MVNKKAKGTAIEKEAKEIFIAWGYQVWKPGRMARRLPGGRFVSVPQDIADVFDLMVWNDREIRFIQVKTNKTDVSKAKKEIIEKRFPDISNVYYQIIRRVEQHPYTFENFILKPNYGFVQVEYIVLSPRY